MFDGLSTTNRLIWLTTIIVFGVIGIVLGAMLSLYYVQQQGVALTDRISKPVVMFVITLGTTIVMARLGSWLSDRIVLPSLGRFHTLSLADKVLNVVGVLLGVFFGVLLTLSLPTDPPGWWWLPLRLGIVTVSAIGGLALFQGLRADMLLIFPQLEASHIGHGGDVMPAMPKLLDTNVIIDGRLAEMCKTGFIEGPLWVPRFVLEEVQYIADSSDSMRRGRGRRGLEILNAMREQTITFEIGGKTETQPMVRVLNDIPSAVQRVQAVDSKLVALAHEMHAAIITNDFNLNRVAELQEIKVLNINELAGALKPVALPGEEMSLSIVREGKEPGQGLGYLDDGTMVVVNEGFGSIGQVVTVTISGVHQTVAGRMIFAEMKAMRGPGDDLFENDQDSKDAGRREGHSHSGRSGGGMRRKSRSERQ